MRRPVQRNRLMSEINITPLTDVMMVLLIIFMVTTPLIMKASIDINLPKAHVKQAAQTQQLQITLVKTGEIFVNGEKKSIDDLSGCVRELLKNNPENSVVISADQEVSYGKAVEILDMARQAGAAKLMLAAEPLPVKPLSQEILNQ